MMNTTIRHVDPQFLKVKQAEEKANVSNLETINNERELYESKADIRKTMKVLVISWYAPTMQTYIAELLRRGIHVFVLGAGIGNGIKLMVNGELRRVAGIDIRNTHASWKQVKTGTELGTNKVMERRWHIQTLFELVGDDFDLILHFQDWTKIVDREKSSIPYYYIWTEGWDPVLLQCAHRTFVPNQMMSDLITNHAYTPWPVTVLPHVLRHEFNNEPFSLSRRDIECSFAGKVHNFPELYNERKNIVLKVADLLGDRFEGHWDAKPLAPGVTKPERGEGYFFPDDFDGYKYMLQRSRFGLNVPTRYGINLRDLEVPASGAILITKKTKDHVRLGFKDGVNCFFYDTPEEVVDIVKNRYDEQIAYNGYLLVHANHTAASRIDVLNDCFKKDFGFGFGGVDK